MNLKLFKKDYECEPLRIKYACYQSLKEEVDNFICRQLGYTIAESLVEKTAPSFTDAKFNGAINCNGHENRLSNVLPLRLLMEVVLSYPTSNASFSNDKNTMGTDERQNR